MKRMDTNYLTGEHSLKIENEQRSTHLGNLYKYQILRTPSEALFRSVVSTIVKSFNSTLGILSFIDPEQQEVFYKEVVVSRTDIPDFTGSCVPISQSPCAIAVKNDDVTVLDRYPSKNDPMWEAYNFQVTKFGLKFYAGYPLKTSEGTAIGMVALVDEQPRLFTDRDKDLLKSIASIVVVELELRTSLVKEVEKQMKLGEELLNKNREIEYKARIIREKKDIISNLNKNLIAANKDLESANQQLLSRVTDKSSKLVRALKALVLSQNELRTLVYNSSHGLKGPVTTLQGLTSLAKCEVKDRTGLMYISKMETLAIRMHSNIRKVSTMHDLINKKSLTEIRHLDRTDFESIINQSIDFFTKEMQKNQIQVSYTVSPDVCFPGKIEYFQYIVDNLLENSIQYSKQASQLPTGILPVVEIKIFNTDQGLSLTFFDNGEGMPNNVLPRIFEMFFRASEKSVGAGLGLYIVERTVRKMNGSIKVESNVGESTNIHISLPSSLRPLL